MKKRKPILTLCSSVLFYDDVITIENILKKMGFNVKLPLTAQEIKKGKRLTEEAAKPWLKSGDYQHKAYLTREHFKKIAKGDAILVVNKTKKDIKGYIGGAVLAEMAVAFHLKKKIYILNPVSKNLSYYEEVLGMQPVVLGGDITKLKL